MIIFEEDQYSEGILAIVLAYHVINIWRFSQL